jgi:hypothetical protein
VEKVLQREIILALCEKVEAGRETVERMNLKSDLRELQ